ncbi:hypothetical protein ONZ51_g629 [Trametes cubensis]|uniref:F-box domain-containing protein n=1 Tax=Trametes cubensis TaxID=1111947 RepID=A0AAD7XIH5_9APHY|nr:hypothetical protein ONZ51_g629 [Trametes cubensis]
MCASAIPTSGDGQVVSLEEVRENLHLEFLRVSALLNASRPINKLPVEIFVSIIACVQALAREADQRPEWLRTLRVCRRWFAICANTPQLWRFLFVNTSTNLLRIGLVRSKASTVTVICRRPEQTHAVLRLIQPHVHRIRRLELVVNDGHAESVAALMTERMLELEAFDASIARLLLRRVIDFSPERLPKLTSLSLSSFSIGPSPILRQLRTLHLHRFVTMSSAPDSLSTLIHILEECIHVVDLHLSNVQWDTRLVCPRPTQYTGPALSQLRFFAMHGFHPDVVRYLLSVLTIPAPARVVLEWTYVRTENLYQHLSPGFMQALPDDRAHLPILLAVTRADIKLTLSERYLTVSPSHEPNNRGIDDVLSDTTVGLDLTLSVNPSTVSLLSMGMMLNSVCGIIGTSPLEDLRIELDKYNSTQIDWVPFLSRFEVLQSLTLIGPAGKYSAPDGAVRLFDALSRDVLHSEEGQGNGRPLCPRLRVVRVQGFDGDYLTLADSAAQCCRARCSYLSRRTGIDKLTFQLGYGWSRSEVIEITKVFDLYLESVVEAVDVDSGSV